MENKNDLKPSIKLKVCYWICTAIITFIMGSGGVLDTVSPPFVIEVMEHLGYPDYFARVLGIAKILGLIAILFPISPTLREWAYAGFTFNLVAASIAHIKPNDGIGEWCSRLSY